MKKLLMSGLWVALVLMTLPAYAGGLALRDEANLLTPAEGETLVAEVQKWPFDLNLLIRNDASGGPALLDAAKAWVDQPNVMVIAFDPHHHKIFTRFGVATHVKTVDFDAVTSSGNASFRDKHWADGFIAIGNKAKWSAGRSESSTSMAPPAPIVVHEGFGWVGWTLLGSATFGVLWIFIAVYRKSKRDRESFERALNEQTAEVSELRTRNIEEGAWQAKLEAAKPSKLFTPEPSPARERVRPSAGAASYAARPRAPAPVATPVYAPPAPVVVVDRGGVSGDLMTGYMLGQATAPREREVERAPDPPPRKSRSYDSDGGSSKSDDGGGSSSSWGSSRSNDSGGSSSSYDSGGSSSSYDSGGSSGGYDSGGGGCDSGGGGGGGD